MRARGLPPDLAAFARRERETEQTHKVPIALVRSILLRVAASVPSLAVQARWIPDPPLDSSEGCASELQPGQDLLAIKFDDFGLIAARGDCRKICVTPPSISF